MCLFPAGEEVYDSGNSDPKMSSCTVFLCVVSMVAMVTPSAVAASGKKVEPSQTQTAAANNCTRS